MLGLPVRGKRWGAGLLVTNVVSDDDLFDTRFLSRLEQVRLQVRKRFAGTLRAERRLRRRLEAQNADFRNYLCPVMIRAASDGVFTGG